MEALAAGLDVRASHLRRRWRVSDKTARRDIAKLKALGMIEFVGPPRTTDRQMVRGGSFIDRKQLTRASQGIRQDTTEGYTTVGVRCAKSALD